MSKAQITQLSIDRVTRLVSLYLSSHHDPESVAQKILFESWQNGVDTPTHRFIKLRCYSALRVYQREKQVIEHTNEPGYVAPAKTALELHELEQEMGELITRVLSPFERQVIWHRFYNDCTVEEIAKTLGKPVLVVAETIQVALYKMKEAI